MKAIVSEYRKMRRIRINEYLLTIHLLWLPFHLYYKRSDLCVYNEYIFLGHYFSNPYQIWYTESGLIGQPVQPPEHLYWCYTGHFRVEIPILYCPTTTNLLHITTSDYVLVQCHNVLHVLNKPLQAIMEASNIDPKSWFAASKDK